jgi:hypothetical protein
MPAMKGKSSKAAAFHCTRVWNFEAYFMRMLRQSIQSSVEFWSMRRMPYDRDLSRDILKISAHS